MSFWYAPSTLSEALEYLDKNPDFKLLAGGTDLLVQQFEKVDLLPGLIGLGKLEELKTIDVGEEIRIGALVTHTDIVQHPLLQQHAPALCQGALQVGAPQIRNMGTIGGNIANASPAADTAPALIVIGAQVELTRLGQVRTVDVEQFFTGPGRTLLEPGEMITAVIIPLPDKDQGSAYLKLGKRKALAIATASVAVSVKVAGTTLEDVKICLGSVGPTPIRAIKTEALLRGKGLDSLPLAEAKAQVAAEITPIDDIRGTAQYRRDSAQALVERALVQAIKQAGVNLA